MGFGVEIHVPISPTESFFQQVHYLAASLKLHGGCLRDASMVVTVGEDCEPFDIAGKLPWSRQYPIEFRWLPRTLFQKHHYYATALQRYRYRYRQPYVLLLDADLVLLRDIDDLLDRAAGDPAVYALVAHASPWKNSHLLHIRSDEDWWRGLFEAAGLGEPPFVCTYTGHGLVFEADGSTYRCPPYFNQGVVLAPASMMETLGNCIYDEMEIANRVVETFYRVQVALALAVLRTGVPWRSLPLQYNFPPAVVKYAKAFPEEWAQARVLHYSGYWQSNLDSVMTDPRKMEEWLSLSTEEPVQTRCSELFRSLRAAM